MSLNLDLLAQVKNRLQVADAPTQVIPDFQNLILFGTQIDPLQKQPSPSKATPKGTKNTPQAYRLPQLPLDASEFTQVIGSSTQADSLDAACRQSESPVASQSSLFGSPTQVIRPKPATSHELEQELTHVSLTDEEKDLDDADTTRDSSVQKVITTKAELQQIERDLSEQKRVRSIQPHFEQAQLDPLQQLFDAFESEDETAPVASDAHTSSSPPTSPLLEPKGSEPPEDTDVLAAIDSAPTATKKAKKKSPIDEYAHKLKLQMGLSPTKSHKVIDLDSDESSHEHDADDIPQLTKEQALVVKQKFSKRNLDSKLDLMKRQKQAKGESLFHELRKANARQLATRRQNNPDLEIIKEIEREEEEVGSLLEREMDRVRRIRKKEKRQEKIKQALLSGALGNDNDDEANDADYKDADSNDDNASEVPDSDIASASESELLDGLGSDAETTLVPRRARAHRVADSGDEESEDSQNEDKITAKKPEPGRMDDSYMFGGHSSQISDAGSDSDSMKIQTRRTQVSASPRKDLLVQDPSFEHQLFLNLPPRGAPRDSSTQESVVVGHVPNLSFQEISSTQNAETQVDSDSQMRQTLEPTQVDTTNVLTQVDDTQPDIFGSQKDLLTQMEDPNAEESDDEDLVNAVARGRSKIQENAVKAVESEDEEDDQEAMKEQLAIYEAKLRRQELRARKRRKDLERRGLKGIVEGEAEESDDEWKGIGGADNEESDQANSEDERMIDNNFNLVLNDEEVRRKFMEQYQIKDRHELEKLIDDIKNHKLTKRARANRFDIELSDEEDEILLAYRRQKLAEQKQRLAESQKLMKSANSEKSKAFFESMTEDSQPFKIDWEESDVDSDSAESANGDTQKDDTEEAMQAKHTTLLKELFVQKQLSFLNSIAEDTYATVQIQSERLHGLDAEEIDDMAALKSRSLLSLYSRSKAHQPVEPAKRAVEEVSTDEDDCGPVFKKPSVVSSFKAHQDKSRTGVSALFSGVTINKQYKVASGSKSSITYMSRQSKVRSSAVPLRSARAIEIEERVDQVRSRSGIFRSNHKFA